MANHQPAIFSYERQTALARQPCSQVIDQGAN